MIKVIYDGKKMSIEKVKNNPITKPSYVFYSIIGTQKIVTNDIGEISVPHLDHIYMYCENEYDGMLEDCKQEFVSTRAILKEICNDYI